jgi:hypothetical protein
MKRIIQMAALAAAAAGLAACEGSADENLAGAAENGAAALGQGVEAAAADAANVAGEVGDAVGNGVSVVRNDLAQDDGNSAAGANAAANNMTANAQ